MQPENDTQAVRRVLARAGITAAALTLTLGAAAPIAMACEHAGAHGGSSSADKSADQAGGRHGDKHGSAHSSGSTSSGGQASDHQSSGHRGSDKGGSAQGGQHGTKGEKHGKGGGGSSSGGSTGGGTDHGKGGSTGGGSDKGHNPPGNNGTVKIHDVAGDLSHHNVPHVDCDFWVPMWGFDNGQQMTVSFAGQAPTGKDTPVTFTALNGTTLTSPDEAGGGNDYDGELGFTTTAESLQSQLGDPQPQQGYHVKMTVATGEPGGYKYKVFWINCPAAPTTGGGGEQGGGGEEGGGGEQGGGGGRGGVVTVGGGGGTVAGETGGQNTTGTA